MSSLPPLMMTYWPATAELDPTSEALHGKNKSLFLVPRWTNPIWTTHPLRMGIPPFNSLLLHLLIQSDRLGRFTQILCFLGWRSGKSKRKSLTSSNSPGHLVFKNGAESSGTIHPVSPWKKATGQADWRCNSYNDNGLIALVGLVRAEQQARDKILPFNFTPWSPEATLWLTKPSHLINHEFKLWTSSQEILLQHLLERAIYSVFN